MRGRIGYFELVLTTPALRAGISQRQGMHELAKSVQPGFMTMRRDGIIKAAAGFSTVEEVLRATQDADEGA